jgi:16S rRNA (cytosine1402-N4)-methyltransferase
MKKSHIPILVQEWIEFLDESRLKVYVDGTLGAGGHAKAVLESHGEIETFIGIDQDPHALELAGKELESWEKKTTLINDNFVNIEEILTSRGIDKIDGILLDLGVSSMQLDQGERGFSFRLEGPLDMRMDPEKNLSAKLVVNTWPESDLGRIFREYGEERQWKRAARAIVEGRKEKPLETTKDLVEVLAPAIKTHKKKDKHPATKIFQALRICVNSELEVLRQTLPKIVQRLRHGAVFGVITFHSLEDRIVKNFFRDEASDKQNTSGLAGLFLEKEPSVSLLSRKPVKPSDEEIEQNPRCRSAKLRAVMKR